jgi:hypothetical protein
MHGGEQTATAKLVPCSDNVFEMINERNFASKISLKA